jgi:hypothetical protein
LKRMSRRYGAGADAAKAPDADPEAPTAEA